MSKLLDVKWQVGRSQLTPVAILEPVELGGTTVSRASLHNLDQIEEKDIRVGDQVLVEKAGYIIPYILESVKSARTGNEIKIRPPDKCPVCEHPTEIVSGLPDNATIVRCVNPACTGVSLRKILHFLTQMEIENLGPQLIEKLIKEDFISQIPDLFTLEPKELQALDRMGEKLATKIVSNISEGKKQRLSKLISALGIENVGKVIAEKIADHFNQSFDAFLNSNSDELKKIDGISDKVADNIIDYLDSKTNRELIDSIKAWWQGPGENLQNNRKSRTLQGKVFVVTGEAIIPRKKIEEIVKEHGGQIKTSVSTKTSHLLIGSKEGSSFKSNKKNKARELEIPIIDEIELFKMIGISGDENYW
jgi:DNA ligase (NAD+)